MIASVCPRWRPLRERAPIDLVVAIAGLALMLAVPTARAQLTPDQLDTLLEEGRAHEAYNLALEHRAELEGEILFDLYYGIAAIESGHVNEGVFALERVVMRLPGFTQARLQLGRGYYLLGEDRRAAHHFDAVMSQDPPAPIEAAVENYRRGMRQRADRYSTSVTGYLMGGVGNDSNVNNATSEDTIDTILGPLTLSPSDKEIDDNFVRAAGGIEVSRPLSAGVTGFIAADFDSETHEQEDEFDTGRLNGRIGVVFRGDRLQTTVSGRAQKFYLDDDEYQDLLGVGVNLLYRLSGTTALLGGAQWNQLDNRETDTLDSTLALASFGATHIWSGRLHPVGSVSALIGQEEADENTQAARAAAERDIYGLIGQLELRLAPDWQTRGRLQYRRSEYAAENVLLAKTREEDYYELELTLDWRPTGHWQVGPRLLVSENDANTDIHSYDRTIFELRARYNFY